MNYTQKKNEALLAACQAGKIHLTKFYLETGAFINHADQEGTTPLHAACGSGHFKTARYLLKQGANVRARAKHGFTPLHDACLHGDPDIVQLLIDRGADINEKTENGQTPVYLASQYRHNDCIVTLMKNEADPEIASDSSFGGYNPLLVATYGGFLETVEVLIENGVNINARLDSPSGFTALHLATQQGHVEILKLLLRKDAAFNAQDEAGQTPLYLACRLNRPHMAGLLLKGGADSTITTHAGFRAINTATPIKLLMEKNSQNCRTHSTET